MEIMVDIETLSTEPTAAVISIGLAMFGDEKVVDTCGIAIKAEEVDGHIDTMTVKWWLQQPNCVSAMAGTNGQSGAVTLLQTFFRRYEFSGVWANSPQFDLTILREWWKRRKTGMAAPWSYKLERDYRTLRTLAKELRLDLPEFEGVAHDPVDDAVNQARTVIAIRRQLRQMQNQAGVLR